MREADVARLNKQLKAGSRPSAIILGAGIIGMAQAFKLLDNGYNVVVIDKGAEAATQCSAFNGNIYNPYYFLPLVSRDNFLSMLKNLFKEPEKSIVRFNFNVFFEKNVIMWGLNALMLSMTKSDLLRSSKSQLKIGKIMDQEVQKLKPTGLLDGHLEAQGQVGFFGSQEQCQHFAKLNQEFGLKYSLINTLEDLIQITQIKALDNEPNRRLFSRYPNRGIMLPSESNIDTKQLALRLQQYCQQNYLEQFNFLHSTKVESFELNQNQVTGVLTDRGVIKGDKFIICLGLHSKYLTPQLGVRLPILPARGWVMETKVPKGVENFLLKYFTLKSSNFSGTILGDRLRICGCAELCRETYSPDPKSDWGTKQVLNSFQEHTGIKLNVDEMTVRDGCRPITPDDVCILCQVPNYSNVFINSGHGSRGMSYCFGAAEITYQIMTNQAKHPEFDVKRFYFI